MYPSAKALKRPEVKAFMDYVIDNYQTIAESAQIVPMTQEQADKSKQELKKDGGRRRPMEASATDSRRARRPRTGGGAPSLGRGPDQGAADPGGADLGAHDHRDRDRAAARDDRLLRRGRGLGVPVRRQVDAAVQAGQLRRPPARDRDVPDHVHRDGGRYAARPRRRDLPVRVREAARAQDDQADPRAARGRADDRVRLLRSDLLHAEHPPGPAAREGQHLQRARGRDHHGLPDHPDGRVGRRGRDVGGPAVAARGRLRARRLEAAGLAARRLPGGAVGDRRLDRAGRLARGR